MKKDFSTVNNWLDAIPVTDNAFMDLKKKNRSSDWNEWKSQGKQIHGLEPLLLEMLKDKENKTDKGLILMAIGLVGTKNSYHTLIEFAKNKNPLIRMEAIGAIGNLKLQKAVSFLCNASVDTERNVRANIYTALGKLGGDPALECLQKGLNDHDEFVRDAAKAAIENFNDSRAAK